MARTAMDEQMGLGRDVAITADYALPLPTGFEGSVRMHVLRPSVANLNCLLPAAPFAGTVGGLLSFVVINAGTHALTIRDTFYGGGTALPVGSAAEVRLLDTSTIAGQWLIRVRSGVQEGASLLADTDEFVVDLQSGTNVDIRVLCDQQGYAGVLPARVIARLVAGIDGKGKVIGSTATNAAALRTGTFPSGSLIRLEIGAGCYVTGRGGDGGRGGDVPPGLLAQDGGAGGPGLHVGTNTVLINAGKIQGGGGGGAGAARQGSFAGPGGGGGAGYLVSAGATGGTGATGFQKGGDGGIDSPGYAGGTIFGGTFAGFGGAGGAPGAAGGTPSISGALAGAAGPAIQVLTGTTLTKLVAGTIDGAEVTV